MSEKKKITPEEALQRYNDLTKRIDDFVQVISDLANDAASTLPNELRKEYSLTYFKESGLEIDILFIRDFANETKIQELVKETGKTRKEVENEYHKQIIDYCGYFIYGTLKALEKISPNKKFTELLAEDVEEDNENYTGVRVKPGSTLEKIIAAAQEQANNLSNIPRVIARINNDYEHPLDKVNGTVWKQLEDELKQIPGQSFFLQAGKEVISVHLENSEELLLLKGLTPYDKRVYFAMANIFFVGSRFMSANMIYKQMGGKGTCAAYQKQQILKSVRKLMGTIITIDNSTYYEDETERYSYPVLERVTENILHARFGEIIINGKTTKDAIEVIEAPFLYRFAKERKQITTFPLELLQAPLSLTNNNILLYDYMIEEIAHIKHGTRSNIMKLDTIYKNCGAKDKMQRKRTRENIIKILNHLQSCKGGIKKYNYYETEGKIEIIY